MAVLKDEPLARITSIYHAWRDQNKLGGTPELNLKLWEAASPNQDMKDSMRFLAELQRTWNVEIERFIREECGCKALINSGNWRTADQLHLLDLDRWSCDANDVIANNRYVTNIHVNPKEDNKAGYTIEPGDLFTDESKLFDWQSMVLCARQVAGKAYIVPESTWVPPGSFASEGPFLVAAYSSLTGLDAYYWFALGQVGFDRSLLQRRSDRARSRHRSQLPALRPSRAHRDKHRRNHRWPPRGRRHTRDSTARSRHGWEWSLPVRERNRLLPDS